MNPSTDVRIDSMIRAMEQFIIPELPPGGTGAEQAALALGHLLVLRDQVDVAVEFERYELRHTTQEARAVIDVAKGGARTTSAVKTLCAAVDGVDDRGAAAVRRSTESIRRDLEDVVRSVADDGASGSARQVSRVVLRFERTLATANRALFFGNGWETTDADLPDVAALLDQPWPASGDPKPDRSR